MGLQVHEQSASYVILNEFVTTMVQVQPESCILVVKQW